MIVMSHGMTLFGKDTQFWFVPSHLVWSHVCVRSVNSSYGVPACFLWQWTAVGCFTLLEAAQMAATLPLCSSDFAGLAG